LSLIIVFLIDAISQIISKLLNFLLELINNEAKNTLARKVFYNFTGFQVFLIYKVKVIVPLVIILSNLKIRRTTQNSSS
jgi:hypothetical protein